MAPRLGELMGSASRQELEIRQDAMTPHDAAHSTGLYCIRSPLTDGEAVDIVQNSPVSNGVEVWDGDVLGTKSTFQVSRNAAGTFLVHA